MPLSRALILERLDEIFVRGTADSQRILAAKYELRISGDELTAPDGTRYGPGEDNPTFRGPLELAPGEAAFVSSYERFHMPVDVAGHLSPRYRAVRQGLLILHGPLVDPGFGARDPKHGEPIQVYVVNMGDLSISLEVGAQGDSILAVAFDLLTGATTTESVSVRDGDEQRAKRLHGIRVITLLWDQRQEFRNLEQRVRDLVIFGLFLLATASLGAVAAVLVAVFTSPNFGKVGRTTHWPFALTVLGFLLFVYLMCRLSVTTMDQRRRRRDARDRWGGPPRMR